MLNAILMSEIPASSLNLLPLETQPMMEMLNGQIEVLDADKLRCSLYGQLVTLIHVTGKTKPWEIKGWRWIGRHPYPTLLRRILWSGGTFVFRLSAYTFQSGSGEERLTKLR